MGLIPNFIRTLWVWVSSARYIRDDIAHHHYDRASVKAQHGLQNRAPFVHYVLFASMANATKLQTDHSSTSYQTQGKETKKRVCLIFANMEGRMGFLKIGHL